jgi:hypothetical protein
METETGYLPRLMNTNLRITSAVILCISTYLIVPKVAHSKENLRILTTRSLSGASSQKLPILKAKSHRLGELYVPPNYGGPDSQHGSGTR